MKKAVTIAVIACGLLVGCGKSEQASATDTAVTETVAPTAVNEPSAATGTASEDQSTNVQQESESTSTTGADSGTN